MYRILLIETGEYLYTIGDREPLLLYSAEEIKEYKTIRLYIADFSSREMAMNVLSKFNMGFQSILLHNKRLDITIENINLFEIVEV
jgi:hypothetical protein